MSSSDDEVIWSKGDPCLAPWPQEGDDKLYKACIKGFKTHDFRRKAVVGYNGYSSSNDERIDLKKLRKIKKRKRERSRTPMKSQHEQESRPASMFSPLFGDEEKKRLEQKFAEYEEDYSEKTSAGSPWATTSRRLLDPIATPTRSSKRPAQRRKTPVAEGGHEKKGSRSSSQSSAGPATPRIRQAIHLSSSDEDTQTKDKEGFSANDLTKPYFRNAAHVSESASPLVLSAEHRVPAAINRYLREYQRHGIRFLYEQYAGGKGGILADDMGLGKTVQVISFIAGILGKTGTKEDMMKQRPQFIRQMSDNRHEYEEEKKSGPFLIIGPASVLYNWLDELNTWGHFSVGKYHKQSKASTISDLKRHKLDVVVTTYETCRDNIKEINEFEWEAVIADEAHRIKGLKAEVTVALKSLKCRKRFGLTGTPLQNKLEELWCILDWAVPGHVGDLRKFQENFVKKIERGQKADATKRELAEARKAQEKLSGIRERHMLRRTKDIIADQLPKKQELVVYCRPAELQLSLYRAVLAQDDMQLVLRQHHPCPCDSGFTRGKCCYKKTASGVAVKSLTFTYLNLLLKVANHVALLLPASSSSMPASDTQAAHALKICEEVFAAHPEFARLSREASFRTLSDPEYCGKMKLLTGMLKVFSKQRSKVLLFSYSVRLLNIIEQYVMSRGYEYRRLDGSTPDHRRFTLVQDFNADPSIFLFLASTKAGGVGLNLTGANVVVIFDPNWNPTHDLQAADRAYRLGQSRDVRVYRLVCAGTVEENVYLRQLYKQQLDSVAVEKGNARRYFLGIQGDKQHKGELFGVENMFRLRTGDRCMTEDIIKRNRQVEDALSSHFQVEEYVPPAHTPDSGEEEDGCAKADAESEEDCVSGNDSNDDNDDNDAELELGESAMSADDVDQGTGTSQSGQSTRSPGSRKLGQGTKSPDPRKLDQSTRPPDSGKLDQSTRIPYSGRQDQNTNSSNKTLAKLEISAIDDIDELFGLGVTKEESRGDVFKVPALPDKKPSSERAKQPPVTAASKAATKTLRKVKASKAREVRFDIEDSPSDEDVELEAKSVREKKCKRKPRTENSDSDEEEGEERREKGKGRGKSSKKPKKEMKEASMSFESVTDVFAECGVVHTHRNREVVGASKAEDHMSRCAVKDVYELKMFTQEPAVHCPEMEKSSDESDDYGKTAKKAKKSTKPSKAAQSKSKSSSQQSRSELVGNTKVLIGQTPKGIRMSQFQEMATTLGYSSVELLASAVLQGNVSSRVELLEGVYSQQNPHLRPLLQSLAPAQAGEEERTTPEKAPKRPGRPRRPPPKRAPKRRRRPVYSDMSDSDEGGSAVQLQSSGSDTEIDERMPDTNPPETANKESEAKDANNRSRDKVEDSDRKAGGVSPKRPQNKKEHRTNAESIESMVNEMFDSPQKNSKESAVSRPTVQRKSPGKRQCVEEIAPKTVAKKSAGDEKVKKGKAADKDMKETFAFLDSVFFD